MVNFTSNTYKLKRKILTFSNKISRRLSKPDRKFSADITYGMLASRSCLLTDVADQLHEHSRKINVVDRLSRHLEKGTPPQAAGSYLQIIFSRIHSSSEKDYKSANTITFHAMEQRAAILGKRFLP